MWKKIRRRFWIIFLLLGIAILLYLLYNSIVLPLGPPDDEFYKRFRNIAFVITIFYLAIISIGLANSVITKDNILNNYTRAKIFTLIKTKPGIHYNEIVKNLNLSKGQTTWHLVYLERYDMIKRMRTSLFVTFYPNEGFHIEEDESTIQITVLKSKTRNKIYEIIKENPGITQKDFKNILNISQSTIAYHLIILEELDLISFQKEGRKRFYFTKHFFEDEQSAINKNLIFLNKNNQGLK